MSEERRYSNPKVPRDCRLTHGQLREKPELRWSLTRLKYENERVGGREH